MLKISRLAVDHDNLRALWDVSLCIEEKECVGLVGANGAGKSTTLGAIIGLYKAAEGQIIFNGTSITGRAPAENVSQGIALVPEGRRLFPSMSVRENLMIGAYSKSARRRAKRTIERVYELLPILKDKRNQNAGELSGGQQQMLAISRALMSEPRLLLLDEPFLGVAPVLVDQLIQTLKRISDDGVTLLLVEQNIHRALDFVQRAYVIENGRTVLSGTKDDLLSDSSFNDKFLGLQ